MLSIVQVALPRLTLKAARSVLQNYDLNAKNSISGIDKVYFGGSSQSYLLGAWVCFTKFCIVQFALSPFQTANPYAQCSPFITQFVML